MTPSTPDEPDVAARAAAVASAGAAAQVATLAVLTAVAVAAATVLAGGSATVAAAALDLAVMRAVVTLLSRSSRAARRALRISARLAARRAHAELAVLGAVPASPDASDAAAQLLDAQDHALQARLHVVAATMPRAARRLLQVAITAADLAGRDPRARAEAAQQALDRAVDRGAITVVGPHRRHWHADTYTQWMIGGAAADLHVDVHRAWLRANGVDVVSVTTNQTQCPRCLPWEGKLLALGDQPNVVAARGMDGINHLVKVAGTVAQARAAGLLHRNCQHRLVAWVPGLTRTIGARPPEAHAVDVQRRRTVDRHVRMWEQRRAAALTPAARARAARRLRMWRAELGALDDPPQAA